MFWSLESIDIPHREIHAKIIFTTPYFFRAEELIFEQHSCLQMQHARILYASLRIHTRIIILRYISYTSYAWLNTLEKNFDTIHRCQRIRISNRVVEIVHRVDDDRWFVFPIKIQISRSLYMKLSIFYIFDNLLSLYRYMLINICLNSNGSESD